MRLSNRDWLADALRHLDILRGYLVQSDVDPQLVLDATALRLASAIDSLSKISDELRSQVVPDPRWRAMKGARNRIAHAYTNVDQSKPRQILERNLIDLETDIRSLISLIDSGSDD